MRKTHRNVLLFAGAQVFTATAVGLALTVATITASRIAGSALIGGLAQTSMIVGATVLTIPITSLARSHGRRISLQVAYVISVFGGLGAAFGAQVESWPILLTGLFLIGGGTVASLALRFAAADGAGPRERPILISYILGAATLGSLVGPNLITLLSGSTAAAFVAISLLYLGAFLTICLVSAPKGSAPPSKKGISFATFGNRRVGWGIGANAVAHSVMVALMSMAPVHLDHAAVVPALIGVSMSAHLVAMYGLSPVFGHLVARWRPAAVLLLGGVLLLLSATLLYRASGHHVDPWLFGLGLVLLGFGWSSTLVAGSALVSESGLQNDRLVAQGTSDFVMNIAGGLASAIGGAVAVLWGYQILVLAAAAVVIAFLAISLCFGSRVLFGSEAK